MIGGVAARFFSRAEARTWEGDRVGGKFEANGDKEDYAGSARECDWCWES